MHRIITSWLLVNYGAISHYRVWLIMMNNTSLTGSSKAVPSPSWSLVETEGGPCLVINGTWTVQSGGTEPFPQERFESFKGRAHTVQIDVRGLEGWDSAFIAFLWDVKQAARKASLQLGEEGLPSSVQRLLALLPDKPSAPVKPPIETKTILTRASDAALNGLEETGTVSLLAMETVGDAVHAIRGKSAMRLKDLWQDIWNAGPDALLIVSIVNFLVGAILAFVGLIELRKFAAEIYVTDLVGIACAREISAIMTAIIMAGRTGGAYAARISTMLGNEEIDALQVFGIPVSGYILLPSVLSLAIMMPILYLYGTLVAILGGFVVSMSMMDVSPIGYWLATFDGVALKEFLFGLTKSFFFACFIALAACRMGLKAKRSAADVGIAATRAVVIGIVGIIAMDAVFAVIANALGI